MVAKRPSETLREILNERGITPTAFGESVGGDYLLAYRWLSGKGFDENPRNQKRAAKALDLPLDHFQWADEAQLAERDRQAVFAKFCTDTELGRSMSDKERASLGSHRFYGGKASVSYYQTVLGVFRSNVPPHLLEETVRMNDAADDEIARRTAEKKRPPLGKGSEPPKPPTKGPPSRTTRHKRGKPKPKK